MAILGSLQLGQALGLEGLTLKPRTIRRAKIQNVQFQLRGGQKLQSAVGSRLGKSLLQDQWCLRLWASVHVRTIGHHQASVPCASLGLSLPAVPVQVKDVSVAVVKAMSLVFARALVLMKANPVLVQTVPAVGLIAFSLWGLAPVIRQLRKVFFKKSEKSWENSLTRQLVTSYMRPIILWIGVMIICRAIDPLVLSTEASHAIKQRFVNFIRSLSTVLAFAFCTASLTQQIQKFMLDRQDSQEARNVGVQFIGNTVYTSVWVAAVCLFMELLGFSTQKWITAGGFGTVLLTLAGREIFTNFLSSVMIHATRPFVESEWIQTKIEGQEVSGTVEHVGWWSPTVIRGDDREAVHIPNHKFTVSVVRNLSQKSHWRIKTHFGISHLDVNKIKHIVADMRKVLAKHPSVEQQRLHRRVFFDNIDPENQALLILVSCFVKTPHFEEYLRVKEVILLDLLKVISHHGARLATPIRSVQRILDENESRHSPFRDVTARSENHRPFLLVEAAATTDSDKELVKVKTDSVESTMDRAVSAKAHVKGASSSNQAPDDDTDLVSKVEVKERTAGETKEPELKEKVIFSSEPKSSSSEAAQMSKPQLAGIDATGLNAGDVSVLGAALEKAPKTTEGPLDASSAETMNGKPSEEKTVAKVPSDMVRPKTMSEKVVAKVGGEEIVASTGAKAEKTSKSAGELMTEQKADSPKVPFGERMASVWTSEKAVLNVPLTDTEPTVDGFRTLTGENVLPLDDQGTLADRNLHSSSKLETVGGGDTNYSDDPWRDQSQAASSSIIAEAEKSEYIRSTVRAAGGVSDDRIAPLQVSQTWEENVLWGVAIEGPKRTLDDEMATPIEQKAQAGGAPSSPRPQTVEDMLIIGVALDGSQRTLPLGDDKSSAEQRELVTPRNGNGSS